MTVTNPIHPLYGREVDCVDIYRRNGQLEVFILHPGEASVQSLAAWATDVNGPGLSHEKPDSHILFRADVLLKTVERVALLAARLAPESEGRHDRRQPAATPAAAVRAPAPHASPRDVDGDLDSPPVRSEDTSAGGQT